jgi:hypothetical protein
MAETLPISCGKNLWGCCMAFNFVGTNLMQGKAYPALATWSAQPYTDQWRQFRYHWPWTVPCELHEHCVTHTFPHHLHRVDMCQGPQHFYTIGLGFFDFDIDYFSLIPQQVFDKQLTVLFYYHEGDNPYRIKQRLDQLCQAHALDPNCYQFVSGNTAADQITNFAWFPDHELLYWHRNQKVVATSIHLNPRPYRFTILNRTHKWWRATVMADMQRSGVLDHSLWSYNTDITVGDDPVDNPIEIDTLDLGNAVDEFVRSGPYSCDSLTADQHNDHHLHVPSHYTDSYCHVVIETHFDADQSGGAFLTEKIFKPIKHGQPFVVVGAPGTLQALRDLGYRTFDHAIDNRYDQETDNTRRWQMILAAINQIRNQDPDAWFKLCLDDMCHNQQHFLASKRPRLNNLYDKLLHQLATT